jgi:hypothetical protein
MVRYGISYVMLWCGMASGVVWYRQFVTAEYLFYTHDIH